ANSIPLAIRVILNMVSRDFFCTVPLEHGDPGSAIFTGYDCKYSVFRAVEKGNVVMSPFRADCNCIFYIAAFIPAVHEMEGMRAGNLRLPTDLDLVKVAVPKFFIFH